MSKTLVRKKLISLLLLACTIVEPFSSIPYVKKENTYSTYSIDNDMKGLNELSVPSFVKSPVLSQLYPKLLIHNELYGNPNIPLGSKEGKMCKTLRRLFVQNKLNPQEIELLEEIKFRLTDLEQIYQEADFEDICKRLIKYKLVNGNMQVPKKFKDDPELGAWVAMVRRLSSNLPSEQIQQLNLIGFEWKSTRKCGSSFMKHKRELQGFLEQNEFSELENKNQILWRWVRAQKLTIENGNLSETRTQYLDAMLPDNWKDTFV